MKSNKDKRTNEYLEQSDEESDWLFDTPSKKEKNVIIPIFQHTRRLVRRHTLWTTLQNQLYIDFLRQNYDLVEQIWQYNKKWELYQTMGQFIGTKNYAQTRIHHHRMIKKYRSIENIIEKVGKRYGGIYGTIKRLSNYNGVKIIVEKGQELETQREDDFIGVANGEFWINQQSFDEGQKQ